jgi:uncharacterized protein YndB with AHSA1/START domain
MLGHLDRSGPQPRLIFTRTLAHPPEKVWRAITQPEHQKAWFPDHVEGEMRAGARLRFVIDGQPDATFEGEVRVFDPPRVLELRWGTDLLRFELEPAGRGTTLTLIDTFDELGKAARDGAGWHECLDLLEAELDGNPAAFGAGERWSEVHPQYVEAFGPEASTIGPLGTA